MKINHALQLDNVFVQYLIESNRQKIYINILSNEVLKIQRSLHAMMFYMHVY